MRVSLVTPTADRPRAFALCEQWMARQTVPPDEWIVADGGQTPVVCTQGQRHLHEARPAGALNFIANLRRGLAAATGDVLVLAEDDDHYSPRHLATLLGQLTPGILAAGDDLQQYYNLPARCWRQMNNKGASLCQTALRREAIPRLLASLDRCERSRTYGVDAGFWAAIPKAAQSLRRTQTCVGVKGLPGQVGLGLGHRPQQQPHTWHADPHLTQLRAWIGADVDIYLALMQERAA